MNTSANSRVLLTPTQRVVLAERLKTLRASAGYPVTKVARAVLGPETPPSAIVELERGRSAVAPQVHLARLASYYETTMVAILAVPAHIEAFDDKALPRPFNQQGWPKRFSLLSDAFDFSAQRVTAALGAVLARPAERYAALLRDDVEPGQPELAVLSSLTDVRLGWLCLGANPPLLRDLLPESTDVEPAPGEFAHHDPQHWTPAATQRAERYTSRRA